MNTKLKNIQNWSELSEQANWSVLKLAKLCKISVRTLERYFLKTMNKKPKSWLSEERHKKAAMLMRGGMSVKATALQCGYSHPNTFSREFKKKFGNHPSSIVSEALGVINGSGKSTAYVA
jgi:transcriptional regulator GlxA family with amidase domain